MAAAFFNNARPPGADWHATSAGQDPDAAVGASTVRLMNETEAAKDFDLEPPRPISAVPNPERIVSIACDVPGAERWDLAHEEFAAPMRDEIRVRAEALAQELAG
jgi:hypothetical protein